VHQSNGLVREVGTSELIRTADKSALRYISGMITFLFSTDGLKLILIDHRVYLQNIEAEG